jgi:hypothetical protein|tara:strand:- start:164 stop:490 length:327 start_codon:yes stop_codon:yes gene_type:complete
VVVLAMLEMVKMEVQAHLVVVVVILEHLADQRLVLLVILVELILRLQHQTQMDGEMLEWHRLLPHQVVMDQVVVEQLVQDHNNPRVLPQIQVMVEMVRDILLPLDPLM